MTKKRRILLLRHQQAAERTAAKLAHFGYHSTSLALSKIELLSNRLPSGQYSNVILTSSIAAQTLQNMTSALALRNLPVFCVGKYTAESARTAGFNRISAIENDAYSLAAILAKLKPEQNLLYPCARNISFDFATHLAQSGIACRNWEIYSNQLISPDATQLAHATQSTDTVFLYSKRTAAHFFSLLDADKNVEPGFDSHAFVAISSQVGQTVPRKFHANTYIASEKSDSGMIDCVSTIT